MAQKKFYIIANTNPIRFFITFVSCYTFHCDFFLDTMFNAYAASG